MKKSVYKGAYPIVEWMASAPPKESFDLLEVWGLRLTPKEIESLLLFPENELAHFKRRLLDGARIPKRTKDLVRWIHVQVKHNPNFNIAKSPIFWNLVERTGVLAKIADDVFEWGVAMCEYGDYRSGTIFLYHVWKTHEGRIDTSTLELWLIRSIRANDHGSVPLFVWLLERYCTPVRHILSKYRTRQVVEYLLGAHQELTRTSFFEVETFLEYAKDTISPNSYVRFVEAYQAAVLEYAHMHVVNSVKVVEEAARHSKKKRGVDPE